MLTRFLVVLQGSQVNDKNVFWAFLESKHKYYLSTFWKYKFHGDWRSGGKLFEFIVIVCQTWVFGNIKSVGVCDFSFSKHEELRALLFQEWYLVYLWPPGIFVNFSQVFKWVKQGPTSRVFSAVHFWTGLGKWFLWAYLYLEINSGKIQVDS